MRINPPVFNIVRALTEDTVIGGYYIPKGAKINDFIIIFLHVIETLVTVDIGGIHRSPKLWENPLVIV